MAKFGILVADRSSLAVVRASLADWLRAEGCPPDRVADLALVTTELATNALEASRPPGAQIDVSVRDDGVELVVSNAAPSGFSWEGGPLPTPEAVRGRGLHIVEQLMDGLEIRHEQETTRVRTWLGG